MDVRCAWVRPGLTRAWSRSTLVLAVTLAMVAATLPTTAASAQEPPPPEIAADDADHVFTFADDAVGAQPSYISLPWQQTDVQVVDSDWALDGKALQISPYGSNAFFAAVFDDVPDRVNTEVLMRFRDTGASSDSHWMTGAGARVQGAAGSATGVLSQTRAGTNGLVLARVTGGLNDSTTFPVAKDNYLRTRWVDGLVSVKVWGGALADEPEAWSVTDHELSSPTLAAGGVGITRFFSGHTTEVDYVAIDELPDPTPAPDPAVKLMAVGNSITTGSSNAPGPQPTYRMYLYDHLVDSGLEPGTDFDFVGPYSDHPSPDYDYVRQGEWDHDMFAVSGWRTANVRDNIASGVATHDPDVVLLLVGVNDLRDNIAPETARDRIDAAITNARSERADIKILLAEIPPASSNYDAAIETYNGLLSDLAAARTTTASPVETVDMYTGYDRDIHHYDDLHPNEAGDELIASRWADALHTSFGIGDPWDPAAPTAPVVTITSGPEGTVETGDASFEFTSDTAGSSFECRLTGEAYTACTSPYQRTDLPDGDYTVEIRATADGVTGQPATRSWTVATSDPDPDPPPGPAPAGCYAVSGDWDDSGKDGLGWWCDGRARLRTSDGTIIEFTYGRAGDIPIAADWDGDGQDSISVIRDRTWHVNNVLQGGGAERAFNYGRVSRGDVPITGAWNVGPRDLPGIVRDGEWHLRYTQDGGDADLRFVYGRRTGGDLPLVGDWFGDGRDTVGVVREGRWLLRDVLAGGDADLAYNYGRATDVPVTGDWAGGGTDTPAIVRDGRWHLRYEHGGGEADEVITFGAS